MSEALEVLELTVNNHPGVMSHITGLFARRGYNLEGIVCMPFGDGSHSRIWLRIGENKRFQQMLKQLGKLEDVLEVTHHVDSCDVFERIG